MPSGPTWNINRGSSISSNARKRSTAGRIERRDELRECFLAMEQSKRKDQDGCRTGREPHRYDRRTTAVPARAVDFDSFVATINRSAGSAWVSSRAAHEKTMGGHR